MEPPTELIELADELCSQIAEYGKPAVQTIARALMERDRAATETERERCLKAAMSVSATLDDVASAVQKKIVAAIRSQPMTF